VPPVRSRTHELDEEVADLGVLRLPAEAVVAERLGAADVGDTDHERLEVLERLVGLDVQPDEPGGDERDAGQGDQQVVVRHQRGAELLHVEPLGGADVLAGTGQRDARFGGLVLHARLLKRWLGEGPTRRSGPRRCC
jgi:hypothetical protein